MIGRTLPLLLVAAALAVSATACGVASTIDPVAAAATKTERAGGVAMAMSMTFSVDGKKVTMSGHGAFDHQQGEMDLDFSDLLRQSGVPAGAETTGKEIFLTESGSPIIYMELPFVAGQLPGGKTWMRLNLEKAGRALGVDLSRLMNTSSQNPGQTLDLLQSKGDFAKIGKETIDGAETTHYHGSIDLAKAARAIGASPAVRHLIGLGAPASVPVDVWVDGSGFVRRLQQRYDQAVGSTTLAVEMTLGMSDYGRAVNVSAPPTDQVFDATDVAVKAMRSQTTTTATTG